MLKQRKAMGFAASCVMAVSCLVAGTHLMAGTLRAQTRGGETMIFSNTSPGERSFALVLGSYVQVVKVNWRQSDAFEDYAHGHAGRYLVFEQEGELHRLDNAQKIDELAGQYAPMQGLSARQKELAAQQKPLAAQQKELSAAMHEAASPEAMRRIGEAQGAIGRQQGEIGTRQGDIGRQQGELGRALNQKAQQLFNECLKDGSCPRVGS